MTKAEYLAIVSTTLHTIKNAMNAVDTPIAFARSLGIVVTDLYRTALERRTDYTHVQIADKKAAYYKDIDTVLDSGVGKWIVEHEEEEQE